MLDDIAKQIAAGQCVLFLGAGVHAPAPPGSGYVYTKADAPPFGGDLSETLAIESDYAQDYPQASPRELPRVAMHFELKPGKGRQALVQRVRDQVTSGKRPSPILRGLAKLDFPLTVTTNYDSFFEDCLKAHHKSPDVRVYEPKPNTDCAHRGLGGDYSIRSRRVQDSRRFHPTRVASADGRRLHPVCSANAGRGQHTSISFHGPVLPAKVSDAVYRLQPP